MDNVRTTENERAAGSLRELLNVAFPLMVSAGSLSLMNTVDRAFLAALDVEALAASMPASMMLWTSISLPLGITSYTNAFVAQYEGANRKDRVASSIWQGLLVACLGAALIIPFVVMARPIFAFMGHSEVVQHLEVDYFCYVAPSALPLLISVVLSSFFAARRETSIVMYVNVATSLLNMVFDYVLIFGEFGAPAMGIKGAAIGTVLAQCISVVVFWLFLIRDARREGYPLAATFGFDAELLRRMLRYGLPNGIQMVLDIGAFMVFIALIGRLGTLNQAATNLAFTLNSLAFVPMLGMGTAVLTLVGRRIGEQQPELAVRTVWNAMFVSAAYMIGFAAIYLTIPEIILSPFMHSEDVETFQEIHPIVINLLKFVAVYTLFDAMAIVFGSAIRGAGETRFSMVFTVATSWIMMVLPTIWIVQTGRGLYACWIAATVFIITLGIGFLLRFQHGAWQRMRVIEHLDEFVVPLAESKRENTTHHVQ